MADDSILKYSDIIGPDDTFDVIFENLDRLRSELESLAQDTQKSASVVNPNDEKAIEDLTKKVQELESALSSLDKVQNKATTTRKKVTELTQEELIQREKQKIANREAVQTAKQLAIIQNSQAGSIERLRAELSLTTIQWKKLSVNQRENSAEGRKLVATKLRLTQQLKKLEKETGDHRREVGNYSIALRGLNRSARLAGGGLGRFGKLAVGVFLGRNLISAISRVGRGFVEIFEANEKGNEDFEKFRQTIVSVIDSLKGIGLSILESVVPIVQRLIRTVQFVVDAFQRVSEEGGLLGSTFKFIGDIINGFIETVLNIPFIFAGVAAAAKQIGTEISEAFQRIALNAELVALKIKKFFTFNEDSVAQLEKQINATNKKINDIVANSDTVAGAFKKAFDESKASFEAFSKAQDEADVKTAARVKRQKAAAEAAKNADKERKERLKKEEKLLKQIQKRIDAINNLKKQQKDEDNKNIKDAGLKALALEDAALKAGEAKRKKNFNKLKLEIEIELNLLIELYGAFSQEVADFQAKSTEELLEIQKENERLSQEALKLSEEKKQQIREDFAKKELEAMQIEAEEIDKVEEERSKKELEKIRNSIGFLSEEQKAKQDIERKIEDETIANIKDSAERERKEKILAIEREREDILQNEQITADERKRLLEQNAIKRANLEEQFAKDRQQKIIEQVADTSEKIVDALVKVQEKELTLASKAVEDQADEVELQRERAEKGLSNTLKFEQEQLAQRESERLRAEKKAEQAAKLQTLFNLVSAYAKSGDTNALQRGLVDFALLEALGAGLQGFEEGGYTSNGGKSEVAGVVHGQEYVVTAEDTKRFGLVGKSGKQFGEAMSDYFAYSPLLYNPYNEQREQFIRGNYKKDNSNKLYEEVRAMRQAFESVKSNDYDILDMTDNFVKIAHKVTNKKMTTINKTRKRL